MPPSRLMSVHNTGDNVVIVTTCLIDVSIFRVVRNFIFSVKFPFVDLKETWLTPRWRI